MNFAIGIISKDASSRWLSSCWTKACRSADQPWRMIRR
jgi:hypothetical protein